MKDELFEEFLESVRQGGAILRGEAKPSRSFEYSAPDVKQIRESYQLSQLEFAAMLGIGVGTLRNWEQARRTPEGAARVLLRVAEQNPEAIWNAVRPKSTSKSKSRSRSKLAEPTRIKRTAQIVS